MSEQDETTCVKSTVLEQSTADQPAVIRYTFQLEQQNWHW